MVYTQENGNGQERLRYKLDRDKWESKMKMDQAHSQGNWDMGGRD